MTAEESSYKEAEYYGDAQIASYDAKVPLWLKLSYILLPIWGALCMFLYWNGSKGWLDRGYWQQLQHAAKTTFPYKKPNQPIHHEQKL